LSFFRTPFVASIRKKGWDISHLFAADKRACIVRKWGEVGTIRKMVGVQKFSGDVRRNGGALCYQNNNAAVDFKKWTAENSPRWSVRGSLLKKEQI